MRRTGFKGLVAAGLVAASVASTTSVVQASDMFLKLSGIKGESVDDKHRGEIDVLSWSWGMSTGTARVKKGTIAPKCIQDLHLTKLTDTSTPQLIMSGVMGQPIKEGTLTMRKAGKEQQEFLVIKMTDILVSSYQTGGSAGDNSDMLVDALVLSFSSIEGEYRSQRPDGSLSSPVVFQINSTCPQ
jgi:type VI secretion system secreted protein Hcp